MGCFEGFIEGISVVFFVTGILEGRAVGLGVGGELGGLDGVEV